MMRYYLGRETDLDLLEPVALALLRKKLETLVEKPVPTRLLRDYVPRLA